VILRERILTGFSIWIICFIVYCFTLCPSVYVADSGELITSAWHLGIAHPPGYPLWCLLGKIFCFIPFGSIAFRLNLMSAFFASSTVLVLFFLLGKIFSEYLHSRLLNLVLASGVICSGLSRTFWSQAVVAEVYTLNVFFIVVVLFLFAEFQKKSGQMLLFLFSFVTGLGLSHHHTMVLFLPVFAAFTVYLMHLNGSLSWKNIVFSFLFCLAGSLAYFYLIIRASANPEINWANPDTLKEFLYHITRKRYGALSPHAHSIRRFLDQSAFYFSLLKQQFSVYLLPVAVPGLWQFYSANRKVFWMTLMLFIFGSFGFIQLLNFDLSTVLQETTEMFFIPSFLVAGIWIAGGLLYLSRRFKKIPGVVLSCLLVAVPVLPLSNNYFLNDRSGCYIAEDFGRNILATLDKNSVYFATGDNQVFILAYLQKVERRRQDVTIYDDFGFVFPNIYGQGFLDLSKNQEDQVRYRIQGKLMRESKLPVYFSIASQADRISGIKTIPAGILYKVNKGDASSGDNTDIWSRYRIRGVWEDVPYKDFMCRSVVVQYHFFKAKQFYAEGKLKEAEQESMLAFIKGSDIHWLQNNMAVLYIDRTKNVSGRLREYYLEKAKVAAEKALELDPEYPEAYNNMGVVYYLCGRYDMAFKNCSKALELDDTFAIAYNNLGSIYACQGRFELAVESWKKALKCDPNLEDARENMAKLKCKKIPI